MQVNQKNQRIVLIRREGVRNTVIDTYFGQLQAYEIRRGKVNYKMGEIGRKYGYSIISYVPSEISDNNNILLQASSFSKPSLCSEEIVSFKNASQMRSLVEYLRNKTLSHDQIYYELDDSNVLEEISKLPKQ